MEKITIALLLLLSLVACTQAQVVVPVSTFSATEELPSSIEAPTSAPTSAQPLTSEPSLTFDPSVYTDYTSGSLILRLYSPLDMSEIFDTPAMILAQVPEGTVVSINDEILLVDATGWLQAEIQLEEGTNLIEIVASDRLGNEIAFTLTVIYEP